MWQEVFMWSCLVLPPTFVAVVGTHDYIMYRRAVRKSKAGAVSTPANHHEPEGTKWG